MAPMVIAGNWKMNKSSQEGRALTQELLQELKSRAVNLETPKLSVVICPSYTALGAVSQQLEGSALELGAQNLSQHEQGAHTGEVSAAMLKAEGCQSVIIGHSERRSLYNEDDGQIAAKLQQALKHGLKPILCVGETLEQRRAEQALSVVQAQLQAALQDVNPAEWAKLLIAYEPVWAIGTGETATPEQAQEVHAAIRSFLTQHSSAELSATIPLLYGGSVKASNSGDLLRQTDINGALVGGASLQAQDFAAIIQSAQALLDSDSKLK